MTERFRPYAAAYLVLVHEGKLLLLRRYNTGYQDGNYSLVAGHLDGGETAKECIIREAKEEAGITLDENDLEVVHVMHHMRSDREYFDVYIRAEKWTGEVTNMEEEKCDELLWADMSNLPENIIPSVKESIKNIQKGIHYSEFAS